ncbi:MAG: methyltransferase, TIGR04325 family [Desulfovibrio sp.]|jgi:putative methyltransferase (TIGR04325 family)|nr:methyltransferase, TIGR04325 family [Desulfovibrio sp.]
MNVTYCTYFDRNYLPRGLAMLDSLFAHAPGAHVAVLCLDTLTRILLTGLCPPTVTLLALADFEREYPELLQVKPTRSVAEYYWTLTPVLLLHVLQRQPEGDGVIYLDADQLFFSSPQPLTTALGHHSVCLQPHRFPKRLEQEFFCHGRYNVGVLGARHDASGLAVISWWRERCLEWCFARIEGATRYGDQKYLDYFAEQAPGVGEYRHPGIGVAPWNHENAPFSFDGKGRLLFGNVPLVLFHFHSLVHVDRDIIVATKYQHNYRLSLDVIRFCYVPYLTAIDNAYARLQEADSYFAFGIMHARVDEFTPLLVRSSQAEILCRDLPHTLHDLEGGFTYCEPPKNLFSAEVQEPIRWMGNFVSWEEASRGTTGYDTEEIVRKAVRAARMVRDGKAVCERDTVVLPNRQYLWPTVSGVLLGAARNGGEAHLVDFGGGLGSMYRTMAPLLRALKQVRWHVVELPNTAAIGRREFQTEELRFHEDLDACLRQHRIDGILMGAVLQYLPEPYDFLASLVERPFDYIILDRTSFHPEKGDRLCIQQVPEWIYQASYPCRALDYERCLALLAARCNIVDVIPALEGRTAGMEFLGIVAVDRERDEIRRYPMSNKVSKKIS